jgi:hypothetical protein
MKKQTFEVTMKTSTTMILAAIGIAALASPVMAQSRPNTTPPVSENNVFWGLENAPPHENAYGSLAHPRTSRLAPDAAADSSPRLIDCVHVSFPQCSGQ